MTDDRNDFDATDVNASDIRQERGHNVQSEGAHSSAPSVRYHILRLFM